MTANIWAIPDHTKAKHVLLRVYLDRWFPIMAYALPANPRLVFVDGFAGPGIYLGGEPGSPIIALRTILDHRAFAQFRGEMVFIFFEKNPSAFSSLTEQVESERVRRGDFPTNVRIMTENIEFSVGIQSIMTELAERKARLAPTLAFVDPFGFSGIRLQDVISLLDYPRCELLFNFMADYVVRFRRHPNAIIREEISDFFGGDEFLQDFQDGKSSDNLASVFMANLRRLSQFKYSRSFKMVNQRGKDNFLIFATQHPKGLEAIKDAMWKVDPTRGKRFSDIENDPLFAGVPDFRGFVDGVVVRFQGQEVTITQIEDFVLEDTDFRSSDLRGQVLRPLERRGAISVNRPGRTGFPVGTTVRFL